MFLGRSSIEVFFVNSAKFLNLFFFKNVFERLLLRIRSLRVSFRKVSGFYCVDDCFTYISFNFPDSLDRVIS